MRHFIKNRIVILFRKQKIQAILYSTDSLTNMSPHAIAQCSGWHTYWPFGGPSRDIDKEIAIGSSQQSSWQQRSRASSNIRHIYSEHTDRGQNNVKDWNKLQKYSDIPK